MSEEEYQKLVVFKQQNIRRQLHNGEWWFSVIDVIEALTQTARPRKYWSDLKQRLITEGYSEVSENIGRLKITSPDGKKTSDRLRQYRNHLSPYTVNTFNGNNYLLERKEPKLND